MRTQGTCHAKDSVAWKEEASASWHLPTFPTGSVPSRTWCLDIRRFWRLHVRHSRRTQALAKGRRWCPCHLGLGSSPIPSPPGASSPLSPKDQGWLERRSFSPPGGPRQKMPRSLLQRDPGSSGQGRGTGYGSDAPGQYVADPQSKVRHLPAAPTAGALGTRRLPVRGWSRRAGLEQQCGCLLHPGIGSTNVLGSPC